MERVKFIVNPAGRGGRSLRVWEQLRRLWPGGVQLEDVLLTQRRGHAQELAAGLAGAGTVVCVGGDGSVGEVLSGLMSITEGRPRLLVVPAGTGNDIARHFGIRSVADVVSALRFGRVEARDLIRVDCRGENGTVTVHGYIFASAGFTTSAYLKPWMKRFVPPRLGYLLATLAAVAMSRPIPMEIESRGFAGKSKCWIVLAGNAERAGGNSLCVAPGGRTDDGKLNMTVVQAHPRSLTLWKLLMKAPWGRHVHERAVSYYPDKALRIASDPPCLVDVDGDVVGRTPATFSVCPAAVEFYVKG
ncbi:MAG: diacylglycerol/lipid kinase family protein [Limisphaerales bacterium]